MVLIVAGAVCGDDRVYGWMSSWRRCDTLFVKTITCRLICILSGLFFLFPLTGLTL